MNGKIKAESPRKCPKCNKAWVDTGNDLLCPTCLTRPNRFYIHLGYNGITLRLYGLGKSKPFRSYFHAKRVLEKLRTEIDEKKFDPSHYVKKKFESYNFERFTTDRWLKSKKKAVEKKQFSKENLKRIEGTINRLILPRFHDKDIRDIKTGQVQEFFDFLPSYYSAKSLKNMMGLLHKILIDAKRWGYIVEVPDFPAITVPQAPPKWIHEDLQEVILKRIKEKYPQHYNIIFFMRYQGTRPGETRALMWDCVDLKDEQILILRAYDGNILKEFPKNKIAEPIPMHPEVKEMLQSFPRQDIGKHKNFVFLCHSRPYGSNRLNVIWKKVCKELGIEGVNLY